MILVENSRSGDLVVVSVLHWSRILFLVTLLSYFDQSNLRREYDGKCRNCPRVWVEGSCGCQNSLCVNSDADETLYSLI